MIMVVPNVDHNACKRVSIFLSKSLLEGTLMPFCGSKRAQHTQKTTLMDTWMLDQAGGNESAEVMTLRKLQAVSSKIVLKTIATPDSVPLCKEEVEAISVHLNSRFERALSSVSTLSKM